jgi:hypothetical protein
LSSKSPYITINALIRYCFAKAPERSRIIRDFRDNPFPPFKGWYGGETEGAMRRYLANGGADPEPLDALEQVLMRRDALNDHDEDKIQGQLHALESMRTVSLRPIVKMGVPVALQDNLSPWHISGVRVSMRPTNTLLVERLGQKAFGVGAIKPYLASTEPLSDEAGQLYASSLHWYAEEMLGHLGIAEPRLSFVVDVFAAKVFQAPASFKQRRDLLQYSCQEIYERWAAGLSTTEQKRA